MNNVATYRKSVLVVVGLGGLLGLGMIFQHLRRPEPKPVPLREVALRDLRMTNGLSYFGTETNPFTGFVIDRFPDGKLKSRSSLSNGVLEGVSEGWHTNGVLQVREFFNAGVAHGIRTKWYASGARLSESTIQQGKMQSTFTRWHENGVIAEEIGMSNNVPHGITRVYHTNGSLKAEARLEHGRVVDRRVVSDTNSIANVAPASTTN